MKKDLLAGAPNWRKSPFVARLEESTQYTRREEHRLLRTEVVTACIRPDRKTVRNTPLIILSNHTHNTIYLRRIRHDINQHILIAVQKMHAFPEITCVGHVKIRALVLRSQFLCRIPRWPQEKNEERFDTSASGRVSSCPHIP